MQSPNLVNFSFFFRPDLSFKAQMKQYQEKVIYAFISNRLHLYNDLCSGLPKKSFE